ncbi:unnamed protein product [Prunus armeniaca]|uniref:non-specific serine/threonine protein kinase n=1 Tax=Prunus armeniaca TaxID=36596 RepID=A0A6J5V0S8_PRUAR|nr:unnamed protein product [Prunus armeniaca]
MILPYSTIAQTSRNISLGSSLTARNDDNSSWPSPSGEFAFGFQQIGKYGFLLAIWFNKIPDRTIVWSANRNDLVQEGSKVELASDGMLELRNSEGRQWGMWGRQTVGHVGTTAYVVIMIKDQFASARMEMQNTKWYGGDYEQFTSVQEDWCRQSCLGDCFCAVAIFNNGECLKKRIPLSNGRMSPSIGGKALIKIRKDTLIPEGPNAKEKDNSTMILVGSVLLSCSGFLNLVLLLTTYLIVSRIYNKNAGVNQPYSVMPGMNVKCFTYEELNEATNAFKEELGRGAFSTVFKGVLAFENRKCVAVKRLDTIVGENEFEFKAEMSAIGRTNHRNLVQLLGFCNEGQHRILVYEFMSKGSLASFLFGESKPNWYQRRQIALGTARGLLYLHEECSMQIIHCDIKPQNFLLDDSFTARISGGPVQRKLMRPYMYK